MILSIKSLPRCHYDKTWQAMKKIASSGSLEHDQLWLLEHNPVFTQGVAGKSKHLIKSSHIPVIQSDRGGQITYHGPGQLIAYTLLDLNRLQIGIKQLVIQLQQCVSRTLKYFGIESHTSEEAPGVYVDNKKICSIGLRLRKGISYHGIALNVNMDMTPFSFINPCGFKDLKMCQISEYLPSISVETTGVQFYRDFLRVFGYTDYHHIKDEEQLHVTL